jgi:hypothetical protein
MGQENEGESGFENNTTRLEIMLARSKRGDRREAVPGYCSN